jgi:hypothetical protein
LLRPAFLWEHIWTVSEKHLIDWFSHHTYYDDSVSAYAGHVAYRDSRFWVFIEQNLVCLAFFRLLAWDCVKANSGRPSRLVVETQPELEHDYGSRPRGKRFCRPGSKLPQEARAGEPSTSLDVLTGWAIRWTGWIVWATHWDS